VVILPDYGRDRLPVPVFVLPDDDCSPDSGIDDED
jgi:hypothetical protein